MEFFDKLGKKASEAYKVTADKTGKIAKEAKIRMHMGELKSQVKDLYVEIGKKVYEKHVREEKIDVNKELEEECTKIDVLTAEIEENLKECLDLKDKKQCQQCFKEIEKSMKFCPECGAKQEETPTKEVEILEKLEHADIKPEKEKEAQEVKENLEQSLEQKSEATAEQSNSSQNDITESSTCENLEKTVEVESNPNETIGHEITYNPEDEDQ